MHVHSHSKQETISVSKGDDCQSNNECLSSHKSPIARNSFSSKGDDCQSNCECQALAQHSTGTQRLGIGLTTWPIPL